MSLFKDLFGISEQKVELQRDDKEQQKIDEECKMLMLYQSPSCMYCAKVIRKIVQLELTIETRNIRETKYREELISGGKKAVVPCLRIESDNGISWMYESSDIVKYLEDRFGN